MPIHSVTINVPGSTSNIGPGFDCMGIALQIYNRVTLTRRAEPAGGSAGESPAHEMVAETAKSFINAAQGPPMMFDWTIEGDVPMSRGLGSSVTLRQGILQGMNELAGRPLDRHRLFAIGAALEGHPDNAAAGVFGGFTCTTAGGTLFRFPVDPRLKFVVLIPERQVRTDETRSSLPETLPRLEAVRSLGNACAITAAFASGAYEKLRGCFDDALHEPYRLDANPGLREVVAAGESAGALGGFLSGSGSAIACLALGENERLEKIGRAMQSAYKSVGQADWLVACADNEGAVTLSTSTA